MVDVFQVRAVWTGFIGGPALNTFHTGAEPTDLVPFFDFYDAIKAGIPTNTTITVEGTGNILDEETGAVTGVWGPLTDRVIDCSGGGDYAGGVGITVRWKTTDFSTGRRLQGRSYLVPTVGAVFGADGLLDSSYRDTVQAAAQDMMEALDPEFGVWHRPVSDAGGNLVTVSSVQVPLTAAILRSRRE